MRLSIENRYTQLLLILISIFGIIGLFSEDIGIFILSILILSAIVILVKTLALHKRTFYLYITLACIAFIADLIYLTINSSHIQSSLAIAADLTYVCFFITSISLITRQIFHERRVTVDTVAGGICLYLLLGNLWFLFYDNLHLMQSHAFKGPSDVISSFDLFYFSFTTLTTVGYGDIIPVSQLARVIANLEAIVGVLFPAVFIARLVSMYEAKS